MMSLLLVAGVSCLILVWCFGVGTILLSLPLFSDQEGRTTYGSLLLGVFVTYALILFQIPLFSLALACLIISPLFIVYPLVTRNFRFLTKDSAINVLALCALATPIAISIFFTPLKAWDARSIWFFHGKMIFYGGGLHQSIGLGEQFAAFSHPDYPKLIPALAALSAQFFGFWNEYVPKISLFVLLALFVTGMAQLREFPRWIRLSLAFIVFTLNPDMLHNGYMDGWLAAFALLSLLFFISYQFTGQSKHALAGLMTLLLLPMLKNEGFLLAIIILFNVLFLSLLLYRNTLVDHFRVIKKYMLTLTTSTTPIVLWLIYKNIWNLKNDLNIASSHSFHRFLERISSSDLPLIFQVFIREQNIMLLASGSLLLLIYALARRRGTDPQENLQFWFSFSLPFFSATCYSAGLFVIYLITPLQVAWHLTTSASRVALPIILLLILSLFSLRELRPQQ